MEITDKVFFEIKPPKGLEHSAVDFARCLTSQNREKVIRASLERYTKAI